MTQSALVVHASDSRLDVESPPAARSREGLMSNYMTLVARRNDDCYGQEMSLTEVIMHIMIYDKNKA